MKKLLVIMLTTIMIVSMLAGCKAKEEKTKTQQKETKDISSENTGDVDSKENVIEPLQKYDEEVTITGILSYDPPSDERIPADTAPESFSFIKEAKERLNINFEWLWTAPSDQFDNKFGVSIAAGELPDVMKVKQIDYEMLKENGQLADLSTVFDYMSEDLRRIVYRDKGIMDLISEDGKIYAIPGYSDVRRNMNQMFIRQDWLDELGLETPTNAAEFKAVMRAFVEEKGATSGIAMSKDVVSWGFDIRAYMNMFGAYPDAWIKDENGKLVSGDIQPEMKEALQFYSTCYKEGLINQDFGAMDPGKIAELITAGEIGIVFGPWWLYEWPLNMNKEADSSANWVVSAIPSNNGLGKALVNKVNIDYYYVINSKCENPEAVIKSLNLYVDGQKNQSDFTKPENGFVWQWVPTSYFDPYDIQTTHENINAQLDIDPNASNPAPNTFTDEEVSKWELYPEYLAFKNGEAPFQTAFGGFMSRIDKEFGWGNGVRVYESGNYVVDEFYGVPSQTMKDTSATLKQMRDEIYMKIIMGATPIDTFDTFVNDWLKLGGQDNTDYVNEWYK